MTYTKIWTEGFDKYGSLVGQDISTKLITGGEFTTVSGFVGVTLVAPLGVGATGFASRFNVNNTSYVHKTLPGNYARVIGGFHVRNNTGSTTDWALEFFDGTTAQCAIKFQATTGKIIVNRGDGGGTLLATSTESIAMNTVACVEFDITTANTGGIAKIYLNGVLTSINLSSQDLCATANDYVNGMRIRSLGNATVIDLDHMYLQMFSAAGSGDTPYLTNPRIETTFPLAEDSGTATIGKLFLGAGATGAYGATYANTGASSMHLRKVTCPAAGQIDSLYLLTNASSFAVKPVVYSDNAGVPNSLLAEGAEVIATASVECEGAFSSPPSVTAGQVIWIGFKFNSNTGAVLVGANGLVVPVDCARASITYASAAPSTFTASGTSTDFWFGAKLSGFSGTADNTAVVGDRYWREDNYVSMSGAASSDTYTFSGLSVNPQFIHVVGVKALVAQNGGETVDLQMIDTTTSSGDTTTIAPGTSLTYASTYFANDPDTAATWTKSGLDSAKSGVKIN